MRPRTRVDRFKPSESLASALPLPLRQTSHRHSSVMRQVRDNPDARYDLADPLGSWRRGVERIEREERSRLGIGRAAVVLPRELVNEVMRLADPHAVRDRDVVIPGGREDLARAWIAARLGGRGAEPADRVALAREIAPSPLEAVEVADVRRGKARYRHLSKFEAAVTNAAKKAFRDEPTLESSTD